ncbi:MAG: hypothetical protein K0R34_334 [Herbinix sp.]|jgi:hypothetical protein|nr:hypothetical protein [Herbinix sp.]
MENQENNRKEELEKNEIPDRRNAKEKLYDKIPISLRTLDIVIGVLIAILIIMLLYFVIRRFI